MASIHYTPAVMTPDEATFFRQLGLRIAERRKGQDLTQTQLGELVGVTQQQIASFEIGRRRMPISTLPLLAKALSTSIEELIGADDKRHGKRGPTPRLQQQLDQVSQLPRAQQKFVSAMLDTVLQQAAR
ncbi:MAG: helix-turn-helix transcriptional regulator [Rhodanobacter sp.]